MYHLKDKTFCERKSFQWTNVSYFAFCPVRVTYYQVSPYTWMLHKIKGKNNQKTGQYEISFVSFERQDFLWEKIISVTKCLLFCILPCQSDLLSSQPVHMNARINSSILKTLWFLFSFFKSYSRSASSCWYKKNVNHQMLWFYQSISFFHIYLKCI